MANLTERDVLHCRVVITLGNLYSLIPKLLLPCVYDYDYAFLLLISLLL